MEKCELKLKTLTDNLSQKPFFCSKQSDSKIFENGNSPHVASGEWVGQR